MVKKNHDLSGILKSQKQCRRKLQQMSERKESIAQSNKRLCISGGVLEKSLAWFIFAQNVCSAGLEAVKVVFKGNEEVNSNKVRWR